MKKTATYGLTHIAVQVTDPERTRKFYQAVFDMECMYDEGDMIQLTTPGCHDILVFEKADKRVITESGIAHFGFRLRDPGAMENMLLKVRHAGGEILEKGEFVPGSPYVFFKDPDGYIVEVWYEVLPD